VALNTDVHTARTETEQQAVIAVITLAFSSDPMTRWSFPDPGTYLRVMPQMARASGEQRADMERVFAQMETHHPSEPCWYLPLIGVDPHSQGRGYGSALLRHTLQQCDRDRMPAYLESSNPRNIPLYQRHGFEIIGAIQSGTSPTIVPMLRRPR
jgi:ribosomal protein S18 acetylase RimI-like enzyme